MMDGSARGRPPDNGWFASEDRQLISPQGWTARSDAGSERPGPTHACGWGMRQVSCHMANTAHGTGVGADSQGSGEPALGCPSQPRK